MTVGSERLLYVPDISAKAKVVILGILRTETLHDGIHLGVVYDGQDGEVHLGPRMAAQMRDAVNATPSLDVLPGGIAPLAVGLEDLDDLLVIGLVVCYK